MGCFHNNHWFTETIISVVRNKNEQKWLLKNTRAKRVIVLKVGMLVIDCSSGLAIDLYHWTIWLRLDLLRDVVFLCNHLGFFQITNKRCYISLIPFLSGKYLRTSYRKRRISHSSKFPQQNYTSMQRCL